MISFPTQRYRFISMSSFTTPFSTRFSTPRFSTPRFSTPRFSTPFTVAVSPIHDLKGDATFQIISTPQFCMSPVAESEPKFSKLCLRLFEEEESTTMSPTIIINQLTNKAIYSSDWTTDSEPECEFRWSATP